jgi:hypothetical protein
MNGLDRYLLLVGAAAAIAGCGGDTAAGGSQAQAGTGGTGCSAGSESCACYGNSTCDAPLTCASHVCVNLGSGGSAQSGTNGGGNVPATSTPNGLQQLLPTQVASLRDPTGSCQGWTAEPEGGSAILEFQVDTTGSMVDSAPSTGGQSKWAVMQTALLQALSNLPAVWSVGLSFFSRPGGSGCYQGAQTVPIAPLTQQQLTALNNAIQARNAEGYTPTEAAYMFALGQVQAYSGNNKYIVLVTDGVPTIDRDGCTLGAGPQNTITAAEYSHLVSTMVTQTAATGVKTFVVGVPGSEDPQGAAYDPLYQLSLVAQAGGTQLPGCTPISGTSDGTRVNPRGTYCHYDMTQTTDLASGLISTLGTIAGRIVPCDYAVPSPPPGQVIDPNRVNMLYNDNAGNGTWYLILPNGDPNCDRGWQYTDGTKTQIHICQITCDEVQSNPLARLTLIFGCTSGVIPG